ncbi:hypothetical protein BE21_57890 [Sorangium cellulosum]|uniref:Uncharacterized protein n=1 Tax=Sorangium cellulosum TaxID=56 RepID=A0A150U2Y2_SORCE|nr:hypothetical protein BE21_57890 [Sorangium cellulosum]
MDGSSLGQLRTNEIALAGPWELREFVLSPDTGFLRPETVKLTPDIGFDGSATLADFVNQNEAAIVAEQHTVPDSFQGSPFLGGSSFNNLTAWTAPGILNNEARHKFSLNTCNGCHGAAETGTPFLHVNPRSLGSEATLSGFMTGINMPDPVTGELRFLNDLGRRNQDLKALVCEPAPTFAGASLNTCNGCHGAAETGTPFLHVNVRAPGNEGTLSGFMTGIEVPDPVTGAPRMLNDLARRNQDLKALVCAPVPGFAAAATAERPGAAASRSAFIRRGIGRVH